ncbi:MAG TPA: hypothetical protein VGZ04_05790 [Acidimicrobiales bacterium]|jgi:hypothetical protein|nr:hypothetical protein [Acidimicrobiales bacterium]
MTHLLRHHSDVVRDEENKQAQRIDSEPTPTPTPTPTFPTSARGAPLSLILGGFIALMVSAWAGIVPFVGPTFGFSPDATASWTWNEVHALGAVVPGAAGVLACLLIIVSARRPTGTLAPGLLVAAGFLAFLCGAWLAVMPVAWPALVGTYFHTASPSMTLAYWAGLAVGPGVLLASFGGFAMGRAGREAAS